MTSDDLSWSVEEACQNAWPSPRQVLLDGWMLRAAGGPNRRTNSVNPLRFSNSDPTDVIDQVEDIYGSLGQASLFRVPSMVPASKAVVPQSDGFNDRSRDRPAPSIIEGRP